jgi:hypothetical protein
MRILNRSMLLPTQRMQSAAMSMLMTVRDCLRIFLRRGMLMIKITMIEINANSFEVNDLLSSSAEPTSTKSNIETEWLSKLD